MDNCQTIIYQLDLFLLGTQIDNDFNYFFVNRTVTVSQPSQNPLTLQTPLPASNIQRETIPKSTRQFTCNVFRFSFEDENWTLCGYSTSLADMDTSHTDMHQVVVSDTIVVKYPNPSEAPPSMPSLQGGNPLPPPRAGDILSFPIHPRLDIKELSSNMVSMTTPDLTAISFEFDSELDMKDFLESISVYLDDIIAKELAEREERARKAQYRRSTWIGEAETLAAEIRTKLQQKPPVTILPPPQMPKPKSFTPSFVKPGPANANEQQSESKSSDTTSTSPQTGAKVQLRSFQFGTPKKEAHNEFGYCISAIIRKKEKKQKHYTVRSLCVLSPYYFVDHVGSLLNHILTQNYSTLTASTLHTIMLAFNSAFKQSGFINTPTYDSYLERHLFREKSPRPSTMTVNLSSLSENQPPLTLSASLPVYSYPGLIEESKLVLICRLFRMNTIDIFNAVFMGLRVIVYTPPSESINSLSSIVTSIGQMFIPVISHGALLHPRFFGYVSLAQPNFLTVPGFVAGVTQNVFEQKTDWWDVYVDTEKRRIRWSCDDVNAPDDPLVARLKKRKQWPSHDDDQALMLKILRGIERGRSTEWVEFQFHRLCESLIQLAFNARELGDETLEYAEKTKNQFRIEAFLDSTTAADCQVALKKARNERKIVNCNAEAILSQLRLDTHLSPHITHILIETLNNSVTKSEQVDELLPHFSTHVGGLDLLGSFLFHRSSHIRENARSLLEKFQRNPRGQRLFNDMNFFFQQAMNL
ncbi:hypothetical protein BLNAU_12948 [Blattamonas nauphoetae]|uniref:UDENN domain-containing protein n=1 Tax=Blattamonas nauphoetae TaxID=2049346 RepID=A0ABQ9XL36_9EUKA|nr:hypothetical protein BLNAU_12948 [Blattamonas nauphoetae]